MIESFVESAMHLADPEKEVPEGLGEYQPPKKKKGKAKQDTPLTRACAHEEKPGFMIREDERNYRQHSQHNLDLIGYSMDEGGMGRSILADKTGAIIGGNGTLRMANQRGIPQRIIHTDGSELIVVVRDDLDHDDPRRQLLAVMDNSTTDTSTFDYDLMQQDFSVDQLEDMGVEIPEVELIDDVPEYVEGETEPDAVPDIAEDEKPVSVRGEVYQLGEHRMMCGDSTSAEDVAKLMQGEKADMVFTDPPYGYKYQSNRRIDADTFDVLKNDDKVLDFFPLLKQFSSGFIFVCTSWKCLDRWLPLFAEYYNLSNMIIWDKGGGGIGDLKKTFSTDYEIMLCSNNGCEIKGKRIGSVWSVGKDNAVEYIHATQKPVALSGLAIEHTTEQSDLVLDLFGGSGSTLIACEQLNRKCRMMELDEHYCDVIRKRWAEFVHGEGCDWEKLTPEFAV